jgi:hypothetical protein
LNLFLLFLSKIYVEKVGIYWYHLKFQWEFFKYANSSFVAHEQYPAMDIRNYPKSFFWKSFDLLAWVRSPGWQFHFFTFLFNLTQLEFRIIPVQKIRQNIE